MGLFGRRKFPSIPKVSGLLTKVRQSLAAPAEDDPERAKVLADIRARTQSAAVNVGYLSPADLTVQVTELLKVRRTQGEAAYAARLGQIHQWAIGVVQTGAAERDVGDVLRGVVRTVVPAVLGGLVGGAIQRVRTPAPSPVAALPGTRAAAVRAKIPYHLYAALAQAGDPRAEQLRLRGLVEPPVTAPRAARVTARAAGPTIGGRRLAPVPPVRSRVAQPIYAQGPLWRGVQPGWFGA